MIYAHAEPAAPVPFGQRYWLVRPLATGGMAEIYLARQNAMAGFEKDIVIKRLKPELAVDSRIVDMFLDEARVGALLNHPNIVHVYDVDEEGGIPYIAMEYIVGEELNQLCRRGLTHDKFLPLPHAVELIRQAAAGMGYFHAKRGAPDGATPGQGYDIVHCDISPTNLLVTEDGFLKVIDFGIARARGQRPREDGMIPGKLSYMSPEQAGRGVIDHRSDIFSLGVVLYEITVGKRLFKGPAHEVIRRLTERTIEPPTFVRRDFPGQLESIIMRALEAHPDSRYQSAYDLADDLEDFLRDARLHSGPVRIARYLDELAEAAGGQRRPELISEGERRRAEQELDFDDRQLFDGYQPATDEAPPSEWDEFQEADDEVAAALGLDLDQLKLMRTPVPHRDGDVIRFPLPAPSSSSEPIVITAPPLASLAIAPSSMTLSPEADAVALAPEAPVPVPRAATPPPRATTPPPRAETPPIAEAPAASTSPTAAVVAPVPTPPGRAAFLPWLVLGTCGGVAIGILVSQLL